MVNYPPLRPLTHWILLRLTLAAAAVSAAPKAEATVTLTRDPLAKVAVATKRHVDLMVPSLSEPGLEDELRGLARAGRQVRVLLSARQEDGVATWECIPCTNLERDGAHVRYLDNRILDAFVLVDGPRSRLATGDRAELAVRTGRSEKSARTLRFTQESDYVLAYQQEFDGLWAKARVYGKGQKSSPVPELRTAGGPFVLFSSANMTPIETAKGRWTFTPTLDAKSALLGDYVVGAMDYAYRRIDVAAFALRGRPEIFAALSRALKRGVKVRLILEDAVSAEAKALAARGARIVSLAGIAPGGKTPRLPANVILIDDTFALTGSYLWPLAAERQAFTSLISLQGPVVKTYRRWMDSGLRKTSERMPLVMAPGRG